MNSKIPKNKIKNSKMILNFKTIKLKKYEVIMKNLVFIIYLNLLKTI